MKLRESDESLYKKFRVKVIHFVFPHAPLSTRDGLQC